MMPTPIRLATRRSALARVQSQQIADAVAAATGRTVELVPVSTAADDSSAPISSFGSTGVFVAAVRTAVLTGVADVAVHSLKDLPTAPADGLRSFIPVREDARDALCARDGHTLAMLPEGAVVATGSPRRVAQVRARRPDLSLVGLRGNVDTRLTRVADGTADAVVLAVAGLRRLGRAGAITDVLPVDVSTPAPGQGALAVECRSDLADTDLLAALHGLEDPGTRAAVTAERRLLAMLEAGCTAPVGAYARVHGTEISMTAVVADISGDPVVRMSDNGSIGAPDRLGDTLAGRLLAEGATGLLGERIL